MQFTLPGGNSHLPDRVKLNEVVFMGSHNFAMTRDYGWHYVQQNVSITDQFYKFGARHFKVPIHWYKDGNNEPEIVLAHEGDGGSNCSVSYLQRGFKRPESAIVRLSELSKIICDNPKEITILKLESKLVQNTKKNGTEGYSNAQTAQAIDQLLTALDLKQRAIIFQGNQPPTLGECRQQNKNLMIFIEPKVQIADELLKYTMHSYTVCAQVDWETDPLDSPKSKGFRRGAYCLDNITIWSPFLEIHFNPANSFRPDHQYRNKYNHYDHVSKRYFQYFTLNNKKPNFLVADFVDQGDLCKFVDQMNSQLIQQV